MKTHYPAIHCFGLLEGCRCDRSIRPSLMRYSKALGVIMVLLGKLEGNGEVKSVGIQQLRGQWDGLSLTKNYQKAISIPLSFYTFGYRCLLGYLSSSQPIWWHSAICPLHLPSSSPSPVTHLPQRKLSAMPSPCQLYVRICRIPIFCCRITRSRSLVLTKESWDVTQSLMTEPY